MLTVAVLTVLVPSAKPSHTAAPGGRLGGVLEAESSARPVATNEEGGVTRAAWADADLKRARGAPPPAPPAVSPAAPPAAASCRDSRLKTMGMFPSPRGVGRPQMTAGGSAGLEARSATRLNGRVAKRPLLPLDCSGNQAGVDADE